MINLIPAAAKKKIVAEYWVRVVSVWLFIISIILLVISLLLLPVYVLVNSHVEAYASEANEAIAKVAEYDLSASVLTLANTQAQMLVGAGQIKQFSELVKTLNSLQGEDIVITELDFKRSGLKLDTVNIKGNAATRQSLSDFRDVLLLLPEVSEVDLPLSNLAKDKDILFSLIVILSDGEIII